MTPPRLASRLVAWLLDEAAAEAVLGDLTEELRAQAAAQGQLRARVWFWRQSLASILTYRRHRRRGSILPAAVDSQHRSGLLDGLRQDLRFSLRTFAASPAFALAAIATLAVGIGAATAIATAADRALLRPLPYPAGDRLVHLGHPDGVQGTVGNVGFATVLDWRARLQTLDELAIIRGWSPTLTEAGQAERIMGMRVSWNYFRTLGVQPALGRDFTADDDRPDQWRVVMLSHGLWQRRFGGRKDIVGSTIDFYGRPYLVAGVLPASFEPIVSEHFYSRAEIWAPLGYAVSDRSACRSCQHLKTIGRLKPGATVDEAQRELAAVHTDLRRAYPSEYTSESALIHSLHDEITGPLRLPFQALLGAVVFVLLVACANVAGLLVARSTDREREIGLRAALGATRGRLVRQLLTESLVLAAVAAAAGLALARWGLALLAQYAPVNVPRLDQAASDPWALLLGTGVTTAALIAFALLPAWSTSRHDLQGLLRQSRQSQTRRALRAREWLMVGEVAAALWLVAGAGLMVRTVDRLLRVDPGFDPRGVVTMGLSLVGSRWAEDGPVRAFQSDLIQRVRTLPGVEEAALAGQIPLGNNYDRWGFRIEGRTYASAADAPEAERYSVTPGYFAAMRVPLLKGRLLSDADTTESLPVVLVGDTTARTLWPGADPLGQRVRIGDIEAWRTVVGVVGDVRHYQLEQSPTTQFYLPQQQYTDSFLVLVVRGTHRTADTVASVRQIVSSIAPDVPVYDVATLTERMTQSVATRAFLMRLLGLFALAALVMASVGLYGVVSQGVASRRREFGIRLALGARRRDVLQLVLGRGLLLVAVGAGIGLVASIGFGRLLGSQLYETTPADPVALISALVILFVVALSAHLVPLRRAVRVDPTVTLRSE